MDDCLARRTLRDSTPWISWWIFASSSSPPIVRLIDGAHQDTGRLEVYHDGEYGTVCDDGFGYEEGLMFCKLLGFSDYAGFSLGGWQASPYTPIWLDDLHCPASPRDLADCAFSTWGHHDCSHKEDVVLQCRNREWGVRLADGGLLNEGRLEVFHDNEWGTVCGNTFTKTAAGVACRMLGYNGTIYFSLNTFPSMSGPVWLSSITCSGAEETLSQCSHGEWGTHDCDHTQDINLVCGADTESQQPCSVQSGERDMVRLIGGPLPGTGRLEVYHDGLWGTVCGLSFGREEAAVVCRMLGYSIYDSYSQNTYPTTDGHIWLDNITCLGSEMTISACSHGQWGTADCSHSTDVNIACTYINHTSEGSNVRLVGGPTANTGRLEVLHANEWGTVCDDGFGRNEARVFCAMLGYREAETLPPNTHSIGNERRIWLDGLSCSSAASSLSECTHHTWGAHDCDHSEDINLSCSGRNFRLAGGESRGAGRLEIYYNGQWGTVCDDGFGKTEAIFFCKLLWFSYFVSFSTIINATSSSPIWLDQVSCSNTATELSECEHNNWGDHDCDHSEDVTLVCGDDTVEGNVRLIGGGSAARGRLEIFHDKEWGTVCGDDFGREEVAIACRMLGFSSSNNLKYWKTDSNTRRRIWLDQVDCSGDETSIAACRHEEWGMHACASSDLISIDCDAEKLEWLFGIILIATLVLGAAPLVHGLIIVLKWIGPRSQQRTLEVRQDDEVNLENDARLVQQPDVVVQPIHTEEEELQYESAGTSSHV